MKYAIMADIHSHLDALDATIQDAQSHGCTGFACLGDIVGGYGQPRECIQRIRGLGATCVKGNFDEYCATSESVDWFNPKAAQMIKWNREQLSHEDRQWLNKLKLVETISGFTVVHGSLDRPAMWQYVFDKQAAVCSLQHQTTCACFYGHIHVPIAFVRDREVQGGTFTRLELQKHCQYLICAGSVGQPRDGVRKPAYAIYDVDSGVVQLRRVDFNINDEPPAAAPIPVQSR